MIIVELAGGLGNQLFQYAFGRSIAVKHSSSLYLDLRYLENQNQPDGFTYRSYALSEFNLAAEILSNQDFERADNLKSKWQSKIFRKLAPSISSYIKEDTGKFHSSYLDTSGNVYLQGYWQNPKYFSHIKSELDKEISFPPLKSPAAIELENVIQAAENAIAVHVRRGDYGLSNLAACTPAYYSKAFTYIEGKIENTTYFIFSDDPSWVLKNIELPVNSRVIDHSTATKDHEDLYLMTQCKHHIIANSSFSWWGAWLAKSSAQIVVAPKIWDGRRRSEDIIPNGWKLL